MRSLLLCFVFVLWTSMNLHAQTPVELAELWEDQHVTNIFPSNVRHKNLQTYITGLKDAGISVKEVGRSYAGREIYQAEWGNGPIKVFMWSQMHGDEPTATSALIDLFTILQKNRDKEWVSRIEKTITLRAVPMLNPDGAEVYIRRNLQGIDINRDALDLKTPEAQLLKRLRAEWSPDIGFNLHNQNSLTAAGATDKQAAISFLVVYGDEAKTTSEGHERNKRLTAAMVNAISGFMPGHIGRYGDDWTPTAFGDNFSAWGTPTILIETGALHGKDEMFLVKMNFIAMATALKSLADGSEKSFSPANYDLLPHNASGRLHNFIFRNATIVTHGSPVVFQKGDIALNLERRRAEFSAPTVIRQIGSIDGRTGLDEYDASNFNVVGRFQPLKQGGFGEMLFYRKDRTVDWKAADIERKYPPDAIFSLGRWTKGEGSVPRK